MSQEQVQAPSAAPEAEAPQRRERGGGETGSNSAAQDRVRRGSNGAAGTPGTATDTTATPAAAPNDEVEALLKDDAALRAFFARAAETTLAALVAFKDADVARVADKARTANLLAPMITGIAAPPASAATRTAMRRLLDIGNLNITEAKSLFKQRFNHEAKAEETEWRLEILKAVWTALDRLPDQDVSSNTVLTTFNAINGGGGTGPSWQAPDTINSIRLGQAATPSAMAHTVRHEVGHAVHAQISAQVNPWLQGEMQFWFLSGDKAGVKSWLDQLDTWPANYTDAAGASKPLGDTEKDKLAGMVETWMGHSGWSPTRTNVTDGQPAELTSLWAAVPEKMKNGVAQSKTNWYSNWTNFQQGSDSRYFFLNHYYHRPYHFGPKAAEVIRAVGDNYTAMSEQEFFANAYAEYFKDPAGYTDNSKWGGNLPAGVKDFFKTVVVSRQPYTAPVATGTGAAAPGAASGTPNLPPGGVAADGAPPPRADQLADATGAGRPT